MQEVKACLQVIMLFPFKGDGLCVCVCVRVGCYPLALKKNASKGCVLYEINQNNEVK